MKIFQCVTSLALFLVTTEALICYECANARSNEECNAGFNGGLRNCPSNALSCENLVRTRNGQTLYFKQCKQPEACRNNMKGNNNGPQCRPGHPIHSECWCCCEGEDRCNEAALPCLRGPTTQPLTPSIDTPTEIPTCAAPSDPENGTTNCSDDTLLNDEYLINSTCNYACNSGFLLEGPPITTCDFVKGSKTSVAFTPGPPKCKPSSDPIPRETPTCAAPSNPENGTTNCGEDTLPNGEYLINSTCNYACNSELILHGSPNTTCSYVNGSTTSVAFTPGPPECKPIPCQPLEHIDNGNVACPPGNGVGTVCKYSCADGYSVHPPHITETECLSNTTWSNKKPCCLRDCSDELFDLVIVLDSSSSIDKNTWKNTIKPFAVNFISNFNIGPDAANVGVVVYNKEVRESILLNKYAENGMELKAAVSGIPRTTGRTNTGIALRHARTTMFNTNNGDRPEAQNFLLLVTDGNANDRELAISESEALMKKGVIIYAVGIRAFEPLNAADLIKISGSKDRFTIPQNGFEGLTKNLTSSLASNICQSRKCPG